MPQYNTTVEDYSPIISFSADWRSGTSSSDPLADLYSDSSFTLTQTDGGTATFTFNGTSFSIFGSKRGNHGFYQIEIDANAFPQEDGESADPGQFQVPLFTSPALPQGLHTVTLTNQGSTFVDIDFITFESSTGEDDEALIVNTVQDTDASFVYSPPTQWGTNVPSLGTYSGSSGHGTATPGAFLTYTFEVRDAVFLYGPVGPQGSPFTVSLDGGSPVNRTANKQSYKPQVLLYSATNLGAGTHVVKMSYEPSQPDQIFAIDYANVYTTPSLLPANRSITANSGNAGSRGGLSSGAVAAIIISLLLILFILAGLVFFLCRRRNRKHRETINLPMGQPPSSMSTHQVAASATYQPSVRFSSTVNYGDRPNIAVDTRSQVYGGSASSDSEFSPTSYYVGGMQAVGTLVSQQSNLLPVKGQFALPTSSSQSLAHIPTAELRANRRVVPGREQDFGPLPPNYIQATEPYGMV